MGHGVLKFRRHQGLHHHRTTAVAFSEPAQVEHRLDAIPSNKGTDLVSGQQLHFSVTIPNRHAHAVAVRVGSDDRISAHLFGELDAHRESGAIFRIRRFHRWESPVMRVLLGNGDHFEAQLTQHWHDDHAARAVKVGINNFGLSPFQKIRT